LENFLDLVKSVRIVIEWRLGGSFGVASVCIMFYTSRLFVPERSSMARKPRCGRPSLRSART
jgi:hypothetical protein